LLLQGILFAAFLGILNSGMLSNQDLLSLTWCGRKVMRLIFF